MNIIGNNVQSTSSAGKTLNLTGTSVPSSANQSASVNSQTLKQLQSVNGNTFVNSLETGDIFSGDIIDVRNSVIKILLGDNNNILNATSNDSSNLNIGDHITFKVTQNSGDTVFIKPININHYNSSMVIKALDAAFLPANSRNIETVRTMMENEMPINKDNIADVISKIEQFPDFKPAHMVTMIKHNFPLSNENIKEFSDYVNCEHRLSAQTEQLGNEFSDVIKDVLNNYGRENAVSVAEKFILQVLSSAKEADNFTTALTDKTSVLNSQNNINPNEEILQKSDTSVQSYSSVTNGESINNTADNTDINVPSKEYIFQKLSNLPKEELNEFFSSDQFRSFIRHNVKKAYLLDENIFLNQNDEDIKKSVEKFYGRLKKDIDYFDELFKNTDSSADKIKNTISSVKSNLNFMYEINNMASYIQLPVKYNGNATHSELYVYNRRKKNIQNTDMLTAFLHLDMNFLGATDVYIKLNNDSLSADFSISDQESMKIVEEHFGELEKRLNELGFKTTLKAELSSDTKSPFEKALDKDTPKISIKRYSFDVRA